MGMSDHRVIVSSESLWKALLLEREAHGYADSVLGDEDMSMTSKCTKILVERHYPDGERAH